MSSLEGVDRMFSVAAPQVRGKSAQDNIFAANNRAVALADKIGKDKVINGTVGSILDEDGNLVELEVVKEAYARLTPRQIIAYAPIQGYEKFLESCIDQCFGESRPDGYINACATPGGTGALHHAIHNYSADGDEVLITDWHWGAYDSLIDYPNRKVASFQFLTEDGHFHVDAFREKVEDILSRQKNIVIILNGVANNPTGYCMSVEEWQAVVDVLKHTVEGKDKNEVYTWWTDLNNDFMRLNQNYQDYIRDLNSVKAEEMMRTKEFLVFKDRLIEYLRSFIKGLQRNVGVIEECLKTQESDMREAVFDKIVEYELLIPRMEVEVSEKMIRRKAEGRFKSIYDWFVGSEGQENEAAKLFDVTNEIIRRITRYAAQLSEKNALGANRKEEYRKVAEMFMRCENLEEAHKMSAMVFGMEKTFHIAGDQVRETDSMNRGVYEEKPIRIELKPRVRTYREKTKRSSIIESTEKKLETRRKMLEQQKEEEKKIKMLGKR